MRSWWSEPIMGVHPSGLWACVTATPCGGCLPHRFSNCSWLTPRLVCNSAMTAPRDGYRGRRP